MGLELLSALFECYFKATLGIINLHFEGGGV